MYRAIRSIETLYLKSIKTKQMTKCIFEGNLISIQMHKDLSTYVRVLGLDFPSRTFSVVTADDNGR